MAPGACTLSFHQRKATSDVRLGSHHSFLVLLQLTDVFYLQRGADDSDTPTGPPPTHRRPSRPQRLNIFPSESTSLSNPCPPYFDEQIPHTLASPEVCERHTPFEGSVTLYVVHHHVSETFYHVSTHPTIRYLQYIPLVLSKIVITWRYISRLVGDRK
jgi:hypothetical protein